MIYLIESGCFLKIGYSENITSFENRMNCYRTHNPDPILIDFRDGTKYDESQLHKNLKDFLYNNEWFFSKQDVLNEWFRYNNIKKSNEIYILRSEEDSFCGTYYNKGLDVDKFTLNQINLFRCISKHIVDIDYPDIKKYFDNYLNENRVIKYINWYLNYSRRLKYE